MNPTARRTPRLLAAAVATTLTTGLALSATACTTGGSAGRSDEPSPDRSSTARPHGWVEGASEAQEPQLRLLAVSASGTTTLHDLLGGAATSLDAVDAPAHSATDGRFLVTSDADRTTITDGGAWTVDHGDHTHYYTADPRSWASSTAADRSRSTRRRPSPRSAGRSAGRPSCSTAPHSARATST